ncbi:MAG: cation diffusion facilitator family transporter [bacterium]
MTNVAGRREREERAVTLAGLVINLGLAAGKVAVGVLGRSSAIIADGLHSASDLASDIAVLWGIRAARRPADAEHPYGHARYEALVTGFIGILLIVAALSIGAESLTTLGRPHDAAMSVWPLVAALVSVALKELLYWLTRAVGRRHRSSAVLANAWHHRSDAFSSVAAAAGIAGALIGGPRWQFLDHLTAVVLAAFLIVVGIDIVRDAVQELCDQAPAPEVQARMEKTISGIPGVGTFHAFRARRTGGLIEMDVHVQVDPGLSVRAGHDIATRVERELCREFPDVANVVVHVEPLEDRGRRPDGGRRGAEPEAEFPKRRYSDN